MTQERFWNESEVGSTYAGPVSEVVSDQPRRKHWFPCEMIDGCVWLGKNKTGKQKFPTYVFNQKY